MNSNFNRLHGISHWISIITFITTRTLIRWQWSNLIAFQQNFVVLIKCFFFKYNLIFFFFLVSLIYVCLFWSIIVSNLHMPYPKYRIIMNTHAHTHSHTFIPHSVRVFFFSFHFKQFHPIMEIIRNRFSKWENFS